MPIVCGVVVRGPVPAGLMGAAAATGLLLHLGLHLLGGIDNPAVSACWAILGSVMLTVGALLLRPPARPSHASEP